MKEDKQSLSGMPLPLLMDGARNETLTQVRSIMTKYQMPAFLYSGILSEILRAINEAAMKEKEEAEQYWVRKQAETDEKIKAAFPKEEEQPKNDTESAT